MTDRQLMQQALDALEESVDTVQHEYDSDWRHGIPTRKAQLDGIKECLDVHKATIAALRERLAHCDRCGKRLGGEGDIHTCTPKPEQEPVAVYQTQHPDGSWLDRDEERFRLDQRNWCNTRTLYNTPPAAPVQPEQKQGDAVSDAFNEWWDADYDDTGNPYRKDSPAYWAWAGWQAALAQPKQKPVATMKMLHTYGDTAPPAAPAQPEQEPFSPQAIRATQKAWQMGYEAAKAEMQPEQEPVEWLTGCPECGMDSGCDCDSGTCTPPAAQRQWVGLTDAELNDLPEAKGPWNMSYVPKMVNLARAIEQRLKEKNNG